MMMKKIKIYDHIIYVWDLSLSRLLIYVRSTSRRVKHETNRFVINSTLITIKPPYLTTKSHGAVVCGVLLKHMCCHLFVDLTAKAQLSIKERQTTKLTTLKLKKKSE